MLTQARLDTAQVNATFFRMENDWSSGQAGVMARQVASLDEICRRQGVGSALLQPDLVLSMIQRNALALDRAAQWDSDGGLGPNLVSHLEGKAKPLPCTEKRQLVATAITFHSLQLKEGQEVRQQCIPLIHSLFSGCRQESFEDAPCIEVLKQARHTLQTAVLVSYIPILLYA